MPMKRIEWAAHGVTVVVEEEPMGFRITLVDDIYPPIWFSHDEAPQLINAIAEVCGLRVAIGEDTVIATTPVPFSHEALQSQIDDLERIQDAERGRLDSWRETVLQLREKVSLFEEFAKTQNEINRLSSPERVAKIIADAMTKAMRNVSH